MKKNVDHQTIWQKFGMFFYNRKKLTSVVFVVLSVFGLFSYNSLMRREGFPAVDVPIGVIQAVSFDSAESNDSNFAIPISDIARQRESLKSITTSSDDQGSQATLVFKDGSDVQFELDQIKAKLDLTLPSGSRVFFIKVNSGKLTTEGDDLLVSVHTDNASIKTLDGQAEILAKLIKENISGVQNVHIFPAFERTTDQSSGAQIEKQVRFDRYYEKGSERVLQSVIVGVEAIKGYDQLELYDEVNKYISSSEIQQKGIDAEVSANFAESIREQISGLERNLLEGLAAVLLVSFVLISLRSSVATAISMTATILITVGVLQLIDYSLNTITLFSLVLCLALIVDDTTIMVEAIDAGLKKGGKYKQVITDAMRKVTRASATGTLTTILAFAPMLFIGGILGKFIRAIPVTIITSLVVSLAVSFVFIPLIMRFTYGRKVLYGSRRFDIAGKLEDSIGAKLSKLLLWSDVNNKRRIISRVLAVVVGLGFLTGGVAIFTRVGFNIFPSPKDGTEITISARVLDSESSNIEYTQSLTDKSIEHIRQVLGENMTKLTLTSSRGSADRNGYTAQISLTSVNSREKSSVELANELNSSLANIVPEMIFSAEASGVGPPPGKFSLLINASDSMKSRLLANDIKNFLMEVQLTRVDKTSAGLTDLMITPDTTIRRDDGNRLIAVSGSFTDKDTSTLVGLAKEAVNTKFNSNKLAEYGLEGDVISYDFGQEEENQDSFASMGKATGPLFLVMFIVMALLFRSILQPVLIFTALPFAFFGVAVGLYLTNNEISFFTMLGVFALIGISLNNTILLTDYANQALLSKKNKSSAKAMAEAITERLRPLLTTSITSVLALLPLALNDPFWEGLAYTLIFGLISSTLLVILVFPYYYLINNSISNALNRLYSYVVKTKRSAR